MKNKILISIVLVIVILVISPFVSAFSIIPNRKITTINYNEKEEPTKDEKPLWGVAKIHVTVYYPYCYPWWGKPCPGAKVGCYVQFGILVIPVLMYIFNILFFNEIFVKYTDEDGMCTFLRPAPNPTWGNLFRYHFIAYEGGLAGYESTWNVEAGENWVYITLEVDE